VIFIMPETKGISLEALSRSLIRSNGPKPGKIVGMKRDG
jgi:hypothetical protein